MTHFPITSKRFFFQEAHSLARSLKGGNYRNRFSRALKLMYKSKQAFGSLTLADVGEVMVQANGALQNFDRLSAAIARHGNINYTINVNGFAGWVTIKPYIVVNDDWMESVMA